MHQHLAWLRVSCQHLLIWMSGDLINEELGISQGCLYLTKCHPLPCFSDDGNWQKCLLLCTLWEWKMGNEHALLCSTCHYMPLIHFPRSRTQISTNQLSVLACRDATSSEHQSSSLHSRFVFTVLDYRCQQEACTAKGTTKLRGYFGTHFIMPAVSVRSTFFSTAEWHKDGF